jgi:hypothetical protein
MMLEFCEAVYEAAESVVTSSLIPPPNPVFGVIGNAVGGNAIYAE